ncbi:MlaD family protein [Patulibacter sp. NPDC049589]|uniref:MlaD family protein n=1 Tax=Patulibacter sp. NPDC049589 TaxID=3154731 RepID=UPI0034437EBA
MRGRLGAGAVVLVAVLLVAGLLAFPRGGDGGSGGTEVDVLFDSARGVSPGSAVKIAGAKVGSVRAVTLTPENRARVTVRLDHGVGPLHRDATCGIRPEGLIGESFVSCTPGTRSAGALRPGAGGRPTVPVGSTTHPVNLADLLNLWSLPTGERARVLVTQLGLGLAASGDDLRHIVQRAHPTLTETRRLLAVVDGQRDRLRSAVERTGRVAHAVAGRRQDLGALVRDGSALAARVGRHDDDLRAGLRALPPLLSAARPALREIDALGARATPVLAAAERSTPGLTRLAVAAGPVLRRAGTTLDAITPALGRTRTAIRRLAPLLPATSEALAAADPAVRQSDRALGALRDAGFFEGLWGFLYTGASAISRYDGNGHLLSGLILLNRCTVVSPVPIEGCSGYLRDEQAAEGGR